MTGTRPSERLSELERRFSGESSGWASGFDKPLQRPKGPAQQTNLATKEATLTSRLGAARLGDGAQKQAGRGAASQKSPPPAASEATTRSPAVPKECPPLETSSLPPTALRLAALHAAVLCSSPANYCLESELELLYCLLVRTRGDPCSGPCWVGRLASYSACIRLYATYQGPFILTRALSSKQSDQYVSTAYFAGLAIGKRGNQRSAGRRTSKRRDTPSPHSCHRAPIRDRRSFGHARLCRDPGR